MTNVLSAIGNTPLVELTRIASADRSGVRVLLKLEGANPGGSVKDRPALRMLQAAIDDGSLTPNKTILEPTSGNTGIGMAMVAAALGFRIKLTLPACVSLERRTILAALGAELELTPGCEKTDGAIRRARQIHARDPEHYFMPDQFSNPWNWQSHYEGTAPEVVSGTKGEADAFVAGMGTTGTLMGCSRYFREHHPRTKVIGIEPTCDHRIQGLKNMSEAIVPAIFEPGLLDGRYLCSDEDAFDMARELALREGIFVGLSSGAAVWGALHAARDLPRGSTVVALCPDRGDRYLSTEVFRSKCADCPP